MFIIPHYHQSIFDDLDSLFHQSVWNHPISAYSIFPSHSPYSQQQHQHHLRRRRQQHQEELNKQKNWSTTIPLTGYNVNEVNIERSEDNSLLRVHARHEDTNNEGDFNEVKRTIHIPDNVNRNELQTHFTKEGILHIRAPYLQQQKQQQQHQQQERQQQRQDGYSNDDLIEGTLNDNSWNEFNPWWNIFPNKRYHDLTDEMRHLHKDLFEIERSTLPGFMNTRLVKGEDGEMRLHLDFNMSGYKPQEITVTQLDNNVISVQGKHEENHQNGSSLRHIERKFTLPSSIKLDEMTSKLMSNGLLRLDAPCQWKKSTQEEEDKLCQNNHHNECHDIAVNRINKSNVN